MRRMSAIEARLSREIGLDADSVGPLSIGSAVRRRMEATGVETIDQYASLLDSSREECASLVDEVVVGETWFFRDVAPFELLREQALQWRGKGCPGDVLHLLSVPCATGEEPYSIAMVLLDAGMKPKEFQVDAVDVSSRALERAKHGEYGRHSLRGDFAGLADRFLERRGETYVVPAEIRLGVRFLRANLMQTDFLLGMGPYDIIFCRNLLIYLNQEARLQAVANLDRLLTRRGVLFLGHAESAAVRRPQFLPLGIPGAFAFERGPTIEEKHRGQNRSRQNPASAKEDGSRVAERKLRGTTADLGKVDSRSQVSSREKSSPIESRLKEAAELANQGRVEESARLCEAHIEDHGPNAAAYYLLGLARHAAGLIADAEDCFGKAVYLDVDHYGALVHLALLLEQRGDVRQAANFRRRADRAAESKRGLT